MGRNVGCFHLLGACMAPFGTMKASPWGEGFQISFNSGSLGSVPEVHCVFSNRDLLPTSGWQPMVLTMGCMLWKSLRYT